MKKLVFLLLTCVFIFAVCPLGALADTAGTATVTSEAELTTALKNESVSTVIIGGTGFLIAPSSGGDDAFVINRTNPVTIQGASSSSVLSLRYAGIVLGCDVTFDNLCIEMANTVRNAIIANGHTLTINNLSRRNTDTSSTDIHIFCGGVTEYTGTNSSALPSPGSHGKVIIGGSSNLLGNIYAGNLSDVPDATSTPVSSFAGDSTITIQSGAGGTIGNIYAHGARESRGESNANLLYNSPTLYPLTGSVQVNLNYNIIKNVYGAGPQGGTHVTFESSSPYLCSGVLLDSIAGLSVKSGQFEPASGSSFSAQAPAVSIAEGTYLGLMNFASSVVFGNFAGGGTLVMDQDQSLSITGTVSGSTKVNLGSYIQDFSQYPPIEYHVYISAPNSTSGSFSLIPPSGYNMALTMDGGGNWIYLPEDSDPVIISSLTIPSTYSAEWDNQGVEIPLSVTYSSNSASDPALMYVPIGIRLNGAATRMSSAGFGFWYEPYDQDNITLLQFSSYEREPVEEFLFLCGSGSNDRVPPGTYTIDITVPADYMENKQEFSHSIAITVSLDFELGDINGDGNVSLADAIRAVRIIALLDTPTEAQRLAADMDGDNSITIFDVLSICRIVAKIDVQ